MDISKESLLKIKEVLAHFKDQKFHYEVINIIIDILRNDSKFDNPIYFERKDVNIPAFVKDGTLYYSDYLFKYIHNVIKKFERFPGYNEKEAFNYMVIEVLLHELAHLSQLDMALKRKSQYDVINDLYLLVYFGGYKDIEHYLNHSTNYVHEYNANLEAFKYLMILFKSNKFLESVNNYQTECTLNHYYDKTSKTFIAEKTLDLRHIEDKSIIKIYDDIPTGVLISNGLPINDKSLQKLSTRPIARTRRKYNI